MPASLRSSESGTTSGHGKLAARAGEAAAPEPTHVKSDVLWFAEMAHEVHPDKPGTNLHLNTGVDERLCQKYSSKTKNVRPSSSFLRALLRTERGWDYLECLMRGSDAPWWIELQQLFELARRF